MWNVDLDRSWSGISLSLDLRLQMDDFWGWDMSETMIGIELAARLQRKNYVLYVGVYHLA